MRLRWHPVRVDRGEAERANDDGGGQGAEYVDSGATGVTSAEDDRAAGAAWSRARHPTPEQP